MRVKVPDICAVMVVEFLVLSYCKIDTVLKFRGLNFWEFLKSGNPQLNGRIRLINSIFKSKFMRKRTLHRSSKS